MNTVLVALVFVMLPRGAQEPPGAGGVYGTVVDADGRPVIDADVRLDHVRNRTSVNARTGAKGQFAFPQPAAGIHRLRVVREGFHPVDVSRIDMKTGESQAFGIYLWPNTSAPGSCSGTPVMTDGKNVHYTQRLKGVTPVYPGAHVKRGLEGRVVFQAAVEGHGRISWVRVVSSTDPAFTVAAQDAVRQWEYAPACLDGKPVAAITTLMINFALSK